MLEIETTSAIYQIAFHHLQMNITSRCNMRCIHCRGAYTGSLDLPVSVIENILDFSEPHIHSTAGFLISGGEPLLHPEFTAIVSGLRKRHCHFVSITTNGTFLSDARIQELESLQFRDLRISISLDSLDPKRVAYFRNCSHAYNDAIAAIRRVCASSVKCIVRATLQPDQMCELPSMVTAMRDEGVDIFSVSSVLPVGRAAERPDICFSSTQKRELLDSLNALKSTARPMMLDLNDPLRTILKTPLQKEGVYGGCIAGIGSFSVEPNGNMNPCPLLPDQVILNVHGMSTDAMLHAYTASPIVHALLTRDLHGQCGTCTRRFSCGGCRARSVAAGHGFLGADPECWLNAAES